MDVPYWAHIHTYHASPCDAPSPCRAARRSARGACGATGLRSPRTRRGLRGELCCVVYGALAAAWLHRERVCSAASAPCCLHMPLGWCWVRAAAPERVCKAGDLVVSTALSRCALPRITHTRLCVCPCGCRREPPPSKRRRTADGASGEGSQHGADGESAAAASGSGGEDRQRKHAPITFAPKQAKEAAAKEEKQQRERSESPRRESGGASRQRRSARRG